MPIGNTNRLEIKENTKRPKRKYKQHQLPSSRAQRARDDANFFLFHQHGARSSSSSWRGAARSRPFFGRGLFYAPPTPRLRNYVSYRPTRAAPTSAKYRGG